MRLSRSPQQQQQHSPAPHPHRAIFRRRPRPGPSRVTHSAGPAPRPRPSAQPRPLSPLSEGLACTWPRSRNGPDRLPPRRGPVHCPGSVPAAPLVPPRTPEGSPGAAAAPPRPAAPCRVRAASGPHVTRPAAAALKARRAPGPGQRLAAAAGERDREWGSYRCPNAGAVCRLLRPVLPPGSAEVKGRSSCSDLPGPEPPPRPAPGTAGVAASLPLAGCPRGCRAPSGSSPLAEPLSR